MTKRVGLYLRVSTKNGQTVDNQRRALTEAIGRRPGWVVAEALAAPKAATNARSSIGF
jgi:DNA invertase Pin-like site-specific DNA recombinase